MKVTRKKRNLMDERPYVPPLISGSHNPLIAAAARNSAVNVGGVDVAALQSDLDTARQTLQDTTAVHRKQMYEVTEDVAVTGYQSGHRAGWASARTKFEDYGLVTGMHEGFKIAIGGEQFMAFDRTRPKWFAEGATLDDLMDKIPTDDARFTGFRAHVWR